MMENEACRYTGQLMGGIGCYRRWVPGSLGMARPGDLLLVQTFKSMTPFGRALYMKGALAVMADKRFLGLS